MRGKYFAFTVILCLCLCTAAGSAGAAEAFPSTRPYPGYADVKAGSWYAENARVCYETGLITGSDRGFEPLRQVTNAEAAAIAARMGHILDGGNGVLPQPTGARHWYDGAVSYLREKAGGDPIVLSHLTQPGQEITRLGFLRLLSAALPEDFLAPINAISALPDTADPQVLRFYNAGILTGVNEYGFFSGSATLTRAEAAAMVSRLARSELRLTFSPTYDALVWASGLTPRTVLAQQGSAAVYAGDYLTKVLSLIGTLEEDFLWTDRLGDGKTTLASYVKETALTSLGGSPASATQAYRSFDVQVFYSRYLDLTQGTLTPA